MKNESEGWHCDNINDSVHCSSESMGESMVESLIDGRWQTSMMRFVDLARGFVRL